MKDIRKRKTIIFDYDGTIHNSIKIYSPSFKSAYAYLVETNQAKERNWKDNEISKWLGYSSKDMWNSFMPHLEEEEKLKCSNIIGSKMIKYIEIGKAQLYEGALEVLNYLKEKGYNLIFLSNCKIQYMNKHKEIFELDKYFNEFYCTEQFDFKAKHEIFKYIKDKYEGEFIIIGDREVDIEIATTHNEIAIGCKYGFGSSSELKCADIIINDIRDLMKLL